MMLSIRGLKELPPTFEAEATVALKTAESVDPDADLQIFIESNKTPKELLPNFVFEPVSIVVCFLTLH